jgi:anti-sigma B factor antagonist
MARVGGATGHPSQPWFRERFTHPVTDVDGFLILDLSGASFCDSVGLSVPQAAHRQADAAGVVPACALPPLRALLAMTEADQMLRIFDTVTDAGKRWSAAELPSRPRDRQAGRRGCGA